MDPLSGFLRWLRRAEPPRATEDRPPSDRGHRVWALDPGFTRCASIWASCRLGLPELGYELHGALNPLAHRFSATRGAVQAKALRHPGVTDSRDGLCTISAGRPLTGGPFGGHFPRARCKRAQRLWSCPGMATPRSSGVSRICLKSTLRAVPRGCRA